MSNLSKKMEAESFVCKARSAFNSAAAKAERLLTDIKSDLISHRSDHNQQSLQYDSPKIDAESKSNNEGKHLRWRPGPIGTKQDWQDRFKNIRIRKRGTENNTEKSENSTMAVLFYDENLVILNMKNDAEVKSSQVSSIFERLNSIDADSMPSTSIMKQLAIAIEAGKRCKSLKDLLASSGGSSPIRERASLSLAAVKSLVLRDKEDKIASEIGDDEKLLVLICLLFDADGNFLRRNINSSSEALSLPRDIHSAPPESFLVRISKVIGSFKNLRKMVLMWCRIVAELRKLYSEELHIPGIPLDAIPDLNSCLLYQKLQVINCCISRKRRHALATESLDSAMTYASSCYKELAISEATNASSNIFYAKVCSGELVLRLGASCPADNLTMLETGEPVYCPITQEGPLLTEDLIKENEEFLLQTGRPSR